MTTLDTTYVPGSSEFKFTGRTSSSEQSEISHAPINGLSDEILLQIFSNLDVKTLAESSLTCKRWNALSFDPSVVRSLVFKSLPQTAEFYKKRNAEVPDNDFFLRSLKSDARMRSPKVQPSSRVLQSGFSMTCFQAVDGKLFGGSDDGEIRIWDIESGKELQALGGHTDQVNCWGDRVTCLQVADGKVFSASHDGRIRIWDIESGKELKVLTGHTYSVDCLQVVDGKLFSSSCIGEMWIWDIDSGIVVEELPAGRGLACFQVADGKVFIGSTDETIRIRDIKSGEELKVLKGHISGVSCLQVANGKVFSGSVDGLIWIWDIESGEQLKVLGGHTYSVNCLRMVDGKLFSGSANGEIKIWDIDSREEFRRIDTNGRPVNDLIVGDGKIFVIEHQGEASNIKVFDFNQPL